MTQIIIDIDYYPVMTRRFVSGAISTSTVIFISLVLYLYFPFAMRVTDSILFNISMIGCSADSEIVELSTASLINNNDILKIVYGLLTTYLAFFVFPGGFALMAWNAGKRIKSSLGSSDSPAKSLTAQPAAEGLPGSSAN